MSQFQTFEVWEPVPDANTKIILEKLSDDNKGLTIWLKNISDKKVLCITFNAYTAYRNMDKTFRSKTFSTTGGLQCSLYQVKHSKWLDWLHEESLNNDNIHKNMNYMHYAIFTSADCVDVLFEFTPETFWLE